MKELMEETVAEQGLDTESAIEDFYARAKEDVIALLGLIGNIDLNKSFGIRIEKYFDNLNKESPSADKFRIPDFAEELWEVYGDFLDYNKEDENSEEFKELDRVLRLEFMPRFVDTLTSYSIQITSQKTQ